MPSIHDLETPSVLIDLDRLERNIAREKEAAAASAGLTPQQIAARLLEG